MSLFSIGEQVAEEEADRLSDYYFNNQYFVKANNISSENKELFFVGRTGSGKSAILEMIRRDSRDSKRVLSITSDDFATQILLCHPTLSEIPSYLKPLLFKGLWKYIIISNILKLIYASDETRWSMFLTEKDPETHRLLDKINELKFSERTLTDQVLSFVNLVKESDIIGNLSDPDVSGKLHGIFKGVLSFERSGLDKHVKNKYLYILIDDLDRNWTGQEDNIELVRTLFECIIDLSRRYKKNLKFVVALRTDIFEQIKFHQTEKIRPYVQEINWRPEQLKKLVAKRIDSYWNLNSEDPWRRFPRRIKDRGQEVDAFEYLYRRTMLRPRDIINFINICISEAKNRGAEFIDPADIYRAESQYSRQRMEALVDEWKFVYPRLRDWADIFAGQKSYLSYNAVDNLLKEEGESPKAIIDVLYKVGFLGFKHDFIDASERRRSREIFSFSSKYASPILGSDLLVQRGFYSYLRDRAEELGKTDSEDESNGLNRSGGEKSMSRTNVFISYNHSDRETAQKLKYALKSHGIQVIIDSDSIHSGESIYDFIGKSIKASDFTIAIVSKNSLLSAWVSMEIVETMNDQEGSEVKFIPCNIDSSFFKRDFPETVFDFVKEELDSIDTLIEKRLKRGVGISDLESERKRYRDLNHNLDAILKKLKESLCTDISSEKFESNLPKILEVLDLY